MGESVGSRCAAARTAMLAGDLEQARVLLDDGAAMSGDVIERAEALGLRARLAILLGDGPAVLPTLEQCVEDAAPVDRYAAGRLLLDVAIVKLYSGRFDALDSVGRIRELTVDADPVTVARADITVGLAHLFSGGREEAWRLLSGASDLVRIGGSADEVAFLLQQVVVCLAGFEEYNQALALCRRFVQSVRAIGAVGLLPTVLCYHANSAYFTADFDEMEMAATEAFDLATATGQRTMSAYARACRGVALAIKGEDAVATQELDTSLVELEEAGAGTIRTLPSLGLAMAALGRGDDAAAVNRFGELRRLALASGVLPGIMHWRADEVEALWRAGRAEEARAALAELAAVGGDDGPWERAAAARARGLLASRPEEAEEAFAEALELHQGGSSSFERARTELCRGEWLRGQGRAQEAHDALASAAEVFRTLDARSWCDRANRLLSSLNPPGSRAPDAPEPAPGAQVVVFGPMTVVHEGARQRVGMDNRGRLLRHLAISGGQVHAEQLIDTLWPDASLENGRTRLRSVLARVRRSFGPVVTREGPVLRWADGVEVDLERFGELTRRAVDASPAPEAAEYARQAIALYRDDLLPLERDSDQVVVARERLRRRYLSMLDLLVEHDQARGDTSTAVRHLRRAIETDRFEESRYLRLAAILLHNGQRADAAATLASAEAALDDLGLEPSAELTRLQMRVTR